MPYAGIYFTLSGFLLVLQQLLVIAGSRQIRVGFAVAGRPETKARRKDPKAGGRKLQLPFQLQAGFQKKQRFPDLIFYGFNRNIQLCRNFLLF